MSSSLVVAMFVVGNILGSGFFMMPALLAPLGANLVLSWSIACSMAIVFSLVFSRLFMLFPNVRSLSDYFDDIKARKLIALVYWISCIVGNAGLLIILIASINSSLSPNLIGALIMIMITIANDIVNYHTVEKIESLLSIFKFAILIALPIAFFVWKPEIFTMPMAAGNGMTITKLGVTSFWAFLGIETAVLFGSGKSAVKGLLGGVFACSILYILSSLFIVGCVDAELLQTSAVPFSLFIAKFLGAGYEKYINFLLAFTVFGALYGWVTATGKMSLAYAESKVFNQKFLKKTNSENSVIGLWLSSIATWLICYICSNYNFVDQFNFVADASVYIVLAIYAGCGYVLWKKNQKFFDKILAFLAIGIAFFAFGLEIFKRCC